MTGYGATNRWRSACIRAGAVGPRAGVGTGADGAGPTVVAWAGVTTTSSTSLPGLFSMLGKQFCARHPPQPTRRDPTPRGRVLGGSSAVNTCTALCARPTDFANWAKHGIDGWSCKDVLPTFKLLKNTPPATTHHGRTGPLPIRQRSDAELTSSLLMFVEASIAHGYQWVHDSTCCSSSRSRAAMYTSSA